jgi:hypothetical protein
MKTWVAIADLKVPIAQRTLRRWCETKQIRAKKIGKRWFLHLPTLLAENGLEPLADEIVSGLCGHDAGMK